MKPALSRMARSAVTRVLRPHSAHGLPPAGNRVAIVKLDRIGDLVLASKAIALILEHVGIRSCVLVVSDVAAPFARALFPGVELLTLPSSVGHLRLLRAARQVRALLRAIKPERVVCLRHQRWDYDELVLSWLGGREAVRFEDGSTRRWRPELRTYDSPLPGIVEDRSCAPNDSAKDECCEELRRHALVVSAFTKRQVGPSEIRPRLRASENTIKDVIVVSPFASERIRDIPAHLLLAAADAARRALPGCTFLILGLRCDVEKLEQVAQSLRSLGPVHLEIERSSEMYIKAVSRARLVISADTATAHIAAAFDRPLLAFLGGGHFGQFAPWRWSPRQSWLFHMLPCFGCNWCCSQPGVYCLTYIAPAAVVAAVTQVLAAP